MRSSKNPANVASFTDYARRHYTRELSKAGARMMHFGPGMMHSKAIIIDDESAPAKATTAANRLITQEKVCAIIGCSSTGSTLAIMPAVEKAMIPVVAMAAGSLSLNAVVTAQRHYEWFVFTMPFTFLLFFIASIAELNRGPFDLPESESELVAGYGTEYSGMRFGMFFLNEYAGMTIMSMVTVTLFLGGWQGPFANALVVHGVALVPIVWFLIKVYALVFALIWIRLSVPRLQVDQLMGFAWKVLIPLGLVNILATAAVLLWAPHWKLAMAIYSWIFLIAFVGLFDTVLRWRLKRLRRRVAVLT